MTCLLLFLYIWGSTTSIQDSQNTLPTLSLFEKSETIAGKDFDKPYQLSYWPIIPGTDKVWIDGALILRHKTQDTRPGTEDSRLMPYYTIDYNQGQIFVEADIAPESIVRIDYQIIPISVRKSYQRQLFAPLEVPESEEAEGQPGVSRIQTPEELPPTLNFSGTKTLSLSMESIRGLTINQPTRLQVNGKVSESVSVMALLSDQDLPLQPEGTTEEIEDLDRILIRIEGKHLSATLGDYEAGFGETEFVLLPKMLEGAQAQGEFDAGGFTLLGAVSRGKTSSVTLQGLEGQNEYRINVDGRYIVMIAGSEAVWLNGEKMRRGEDNDYIIGDYGDPIVEFTNKHLITGNDVIVVDFEYIEEDRNYRQDLYGTRGKVNLLRKRGYADSFLRKGLTLGVSYATESDDKDNPLIILNNEEIGSLVDNDLDPDGDGILLPAPTKRSVIGFDGIMSLGDSTDLKGEVALSKLDPNTFSVHDELEEGKAWKLNGSSGTDKFRANFDFRKLDSDFVPIGATFSSRTRTTYQRDFDNVTFGDTPSSISATPSGEESYNLNLRYEPMEHVELRGDLGRATHESSVESGSIFASRRTDHWSRTLKIALPDIPQINTRYQEVITEIDGQDDLRKTREFWEMDHKLWEKLNVAAQSEEIESIASAGSTSGDDRRREERRFHVEVPSLKKVSLSGEYSFETEYTNPTSRTWVKSSSARTISADLSARPKSWLDFSGYFARREFSRLSDSGSIDIPSASESDDAVSDDSTTNLADLKLNLKPLRINYQIDKKLSTEREEQYVNYILTEVDGREEKRFLNPGEGSYVKIDEYTYREDMEKGDYIRLVRTVRDRPVTSLALQSVFSFRPRSSFRKRSEEDQSKSISRRLMESLSMLELGLRISEEQERASRKFYLLQDLQTSKTIYGLRRYWCRTQVSPVKRFSLTANWESGKTINRRVNSRSREFRSDRWNVRLESPMTARFSLGGDWEQDNSSESVSGLSESGDSGLISDISERQRSRSVFLRYNSTKALSRIKLEASYDTEQDEDALSEDPAVSTKTVSLGSEVMWSIRGRGTTTAKYEIARGTSSGKLPFARFDFHEGISHKVRLEVSYRLRWFTDITARLIYRGEMAQREKPDHRLEMEMTADF